jgi:hypothetical protein
MDLNLDGPAVPWLKPVLRKRREKQREREWALQVVRHLIQEWHQAKTAHDKQVQHLKQLEAYQQFLKNRHLEALERVKELTSRVQLAKSSLKSFRELKSVSEEPQLSRSAKNLKVALDELHQSMILKDGLASQGGDPPPLFEPVLARIREDAFVLGVEGTRDTLVFKTLVSEPIAAPISGRVHYVEKREVGYAVGLRDEMNRVWELQPFSEVSVQIDDQLWPLDVLGKPAGEKLWVSLEREMAASVGEGTHPFEIWMKPKPKERDP